MTKAKKRFVPGTRVGPYELVRLLGQGGMGSVHEARSASGPVAIKLLSGYQPMQGLDPRFQREAEALRTLQHPGIVPVLDVGMDTATNTPYIVMELLDGDDLDSVIGRTGRLAPETVVGIGLEVGRALAHAHLHNLIHRDIKPANVFLPRDVARGRAILCDFGLAKRTDLLGSLTETGALLGTPHYMSPEQFLDAKRVDARTDVWSLGMTLLHALVGSHPLEAIDDPGQIMITLCTKPIPDARDLLSTAPAELADALAQALVTDPRKRGSLTDLLTALELVEEGLPRVSQKPRRASTGGGPRSRRAAAPSTEDEAPTSLALVQGSYRVISRNSGAGLVYEGLDPDRRVVRIERFPGLLRTDGGREAFEQEVFALRSVLTESILAVLDDGAVGDDAWLVTEPKDGQDLESFVQEAGPLPYLVAVRAFAKLARGLSSLGDVGIVHGALRPEAFHLRSGKGASNLLVLHDLGIARRLSAFMARSATSSPPRRKGANVRTDVVGIVASLSFVLTGVLPFAGRSKLSLGGEALAKVGAGMAEKRALEGLLRRAIADDIPDLDALSDDLSALAER